MTAALQDAFLVGAQAGAVLAGFVAVLSVVALVVYLVLVAGAVVLDRLADL